jgi:hypothetical protein
VRAAARGLVRVRIRTRTRVRVRVRVRVEGRVRVRVRVRARARVRVARRAVRGARVAGVLDNLAEGDRRLQVLVDPLGHLPQ